MHKAQKLSKEIKEKAEENEDDDKPSDPDILTANFQVEMEHISKQN